MNDASFAGSVEVERDLTCRAPDGAALRADVYRPTEAGPHPALLLRLPYGKTGADSDVAMVHPAWIARLGFVVVVQDVRGRWSSEGEFFPFRHEAADGHAAINWTAGLDACDGRVISYGFSYPGLIQLLAAARAPRALVGICPAFTGSQVYEGWAYRGGALTGFTVEWALEMGLDGARRANDHSAFQALRSQLASRDAWFAYESGSELDRAVNTYSPWLEQWCRHPHDDGFWDEWNAENLYSQIGVPALHVGGWWDHFVGGTIRNFEGLRAEATTSTARAGQRLVLGPWRHMPWTPTGEPHAAPAHPPPAGPEIVDLHVEWWRQIFYGEPAPSLAAPIRVWVSGERWRELEEWPSDQATTTLYLHSGGRAATRFGDGRLDDAAPADELPDVVAYDPWMVAARQGGHGCCLAEVSPMGPACQCGAEESPSLLVYTSGALRDPVVLLGDVWVDVWMSADAPSVDLCARLCVVDTDGCSTNLLEGVRRVRTARPGDGNHVHPPGCHRVALGPVGRQLASGERLRLDLAGADHPLWDLNLTTDEAWTPTRKSFGATATQVIFHDATRPSVLRLPTADTALWPSATGR